MRPTTRPWSVILCALALAAWTPGARADAVRMLASDDRGVTLEVVVPDWTVSAPGTDGRVQLDAAGFHALSEPGRPMLPAIGTTLAVPPGAMVTARVVSATDEVVRDGLRFAIALRHVSVRDASGGSEPGLEAVPAIADGEWPANLVLAGAPWEVRGRRFVSLEFRPFHADERTGRLTVVRRLTVRVEFSRPAPRGGVPVPDRHADALFEGTVPNFAQARSWRQAPGGPASFRPGPTRFARGASTPAGVHAADGTQPWVRVTVDSTALVMMLADDLFAAGYPAGVPISEVSVQRFEFLEGQDPPFGAVDVPCEVEDFGADGTFDSGDAIWVWTRNWAERSGASLMQRFWGDAEVLYVTRDAAHAARVPQRRGWRDATGLTPLATYPNRQHYEKNYEYSAYPADTTQDVFQWSPGTTLYYDRPDTIAFEVTQIDTTQPVLATVAWQGRDASSHWVFSAIRNGRSNLTMVIDSLSFIGKQPFVRSLSIPGGSLTEGRTNFLRSWAKTYSIPPDPLNNQFTAANLNWFEITWQRRFRAIKDYLECNSGAASGPFQLHLQGFTANTRVRAYDVTDPANPVRLTLEPAPVNEPGIGWAYELQDSAGAAPRRYVVARNPKIVPANRYQAMTLTDVAGATGADYLIVVPEAFRSALQPLVDLRTQQGLRVHVAPVEAVYDAFNGGRRSAWAIRRFAEFAYRKWDTRFLLLFGDGTMDARGFGRLGQTDWVPIFPIQGPVAVLQGQEFIASDPWYGCVSDSVKAQLAARQALIPDLFVGRLPAQSLAQAQGMVAKIVRYEQVAATDTWRRHVLLQSDDAFSGDSFFNPTGASTYCYRNYEEVFRQINEQCDSVIVRDAGLRDYNAEVFNNRYYLGDVEIEPPSPGDTCRVANVGLYRARLQPPLFNRLNAGVLWWNFQGHANESLLAHEEFYRHEGTALSDASLFSNTDSLFFFTAFSCHANAFAYMQRSDSNRDPCIGEEMVQIPGRGAIATYASTGFELVPTNATRHFNVFLARALFADPPRDEILGDRGSRVVLGEAIAKCLYQLRPSVQFNPGEYNVSLSYNLLGDPALRMSIGQPRAYVSANGTPVNDGQAVRLHTPGDTLQLVADLVSTARLDSLGLWDESAAGRVPVDAADYSVSPAFPDTAASNTYGGRRYTLVHRAPLRAETYDYRIRTIDRDGLVRDFVVPFQLRGVLRVDGTPIAPGDPVAPAANLSLLFLSPKPVDPVADLALTINGSAQPFDAVAAPGDASGREWILSWTHAPYPRDAYNVHVAVAGASQGVDVPFNVTVQGGELRFDNLFAFPNPFEDELGVRISFLLAGSEAADVRFTVFTVTGRQIYTRTEHGLAPGYHQLAWDGRDLEGDKLANGVYFYRVSAATPGGSRTEQLGRLAKLRKPRRVAEPATP